MCIVAARGATYARLQFHTGLAVAVEIAVAVDHKAAFPASDEDAWEQEYLDSVSSIDPQWWNSNQTPLSVGSYPTTEENDWLQEIDATFEVGELV